MTGVGGRVSAAASLVYGKAGLDAAHNPTRGAVDVAVQRLGAGCIKFEEGCRAAAETRTIFGRRRIVIRNGLPMRYVHYLVGREVGRDAIENETWFEALPFDAQEEALDGMGAWICAPSPCFDRLARRSSVAGLAHEFWLPECVITTRMMLPRLWGSSPRMKRLSSQS